MTVFSDAHATAGRTYLAAIFLVLGIAAYSFGIFLIVLAVMEGLSRQPYSATTLGLLLILLFVVLMVVAIVFFCVVLWLRVAEVRRDAGRLHIRYATGKLTTVNASQVRMLCRCFLIDLTDISRLGTPGVVLHAGFRIFATAGTVQQSEELLRSLE